MSAIGWKSLKQEGGDFRTGVMGVALRHLGTTAWLREMLKMFVKTSMQSFAQSLSTQPGMLS